LSSLLQIIKQLGQRDRQAGWVRALQTFLWLQAHDPRKASNRVYTAVIDSLGRAGQLEVRLEFIEDVSLSKEDDLLLCQRTGNLHIRNVRRYQ
jgi:methionine salvage enolase-phosphatase E1